jgi:hypothetical protein
VFPQERDVVGGRHVAATDREYKASAERPPDPPERRVPAMSTDDEPVRGEFKILRSATGAFKDPAVMQRYLAEEAQAGWTLVEKFDNSRIRLKRPAAARQQDAQCTSGGERPIETRRCWDQSAKIGWFRLSSGMRWACSGPNQFHRPGRP